MAFIKITRFHKIIYNLGKLRLMFTNFVKDMLTKDDCQP